jgi:F0F1-type ATP synthase membrane subunit b/b'
MHFPRVLPLLFAIVVLGSGCQSVYYATMEKFGVEKRDLLKKAVISARDSQEEAATEFKDALTKLREMYAVNGGDLEKNYDKLKGEYEDADQGATAVRKRIRDMDQVAGDLFAEWEKEIAEFTNPTYASNSRRQLNETRTKYQQLAASVKSAEASMEPVLKQLKEQVLYLKHNLNAAAIGSLRGEAASIQADITRLIDQMNGSIRQADDFIKTLPE